MLTYTWTEVGLQLIKSNEYKDGNKVAKPGIHFTVLESVDDTYFTLPLEPATLVTAGFW